MSSNTLTSSLGPEGIGILSEFIDDHRYNLVDVLERVPLSRALRDCALRLQGRAIGMPSAFIWLNDYFEGVCLHALSMVSYRTTPAIGLLADAYSFFPIRPARYALRPASTASFMAFAMSSASSASAMAVFISSPS